MVLKYIIPLDFQSKEHYFNICIFHSSRAIGTIQNTNELSTCIQTSEVAVSLFMFVSLTCLFGVAVSSVCFN